MRRREIRRATNRESFFRRQAHRGYARFFSWANQFSSVAHAAIGELFGMDVVFFYQLFSQRELVGRRPVQIENFIARADVFFRRTMTFETPFHVKRVRLPGERHLIELAVTGRAANAVIDVNTVVEKNKIRRVRDAVPAQRNIFCEAFAHGRKHRRVFPDLRMAGHADFRRRHAGECGFFDGGVAETTINSQSINVMFVTEGHGLFERNVHASCIGRPINGVQNPDARAKQN
jgi:hypothetical protein